MSRERVDEILVAAGVHDNGGLGFGCLGRFGIGGRRTAGDQAYGEGCTAREQSQTTGEVHDSPEGRKETDITEKTYTLRPASTTLPYPQFDSVEPLGAAILGIRVARTYTVSPGFNCSASLSPRVICAVNCSPVAEFSSSTFTSNPR